MHDVWEHERVLVRNTSKAPDVIPKPRAFTSEARDLTSSDLVEAHGFSHAETETNLDGFSR